MAPGHAAALRQCLPFGICHRVLADEPHLLCASSGLCSAVLSSPRLRAHPTTCTISAGPALKERDERNRSAKTEAATDQLLVQRFNHGDASAFDEIVERYRGRIQLLAGRFLRNHADAEEIAQDTFIRAHRGLARFRGDSSLATWLHRITVNLARNRYWYFFRRRKHLTLSLDCPLSSEANGTFADLVASDDAGPVRDAATGEFVLLVAACMNRLDAGHREILTLRNDLHHSYDEIAHELGVNPGTVKSRIARARGKLRGLMAEACPEFSTEAAAREWFEPVRSHRGISALNAA